MNNKRNNKKKNIMSALPQYMYGVIIAALLLVVFGMGIAIVRNTPTRERMSLSDYYNISQENEMAVIVNGRFDEREDKDTGVHGVITGEKAYINIDYLKSVIDTGYVYDRNEGILRYVTDKEIVEARVDSSEYMLDKDRKTMEEPVIVRDGGAYYILMDFVAQFSDIQYQIYGEPYRLVVETGGTEKSVATVKRDTQVRKNGGVKSRILSDVEKKQEVTVLQDYGKWSKVVTADGVIGYIKNSCLKEHKKQTVANNLPERQYNHILSDDRIVMAWHQVTNRSANKNVGEVIDSTTINVVSPTWFYMNDNQGGIEDLASYEYVDYCHNHGIRVWALFSNFENKNVDTATVLNTTSARDTLINNLIASAITYKLDGINIDVEALPASAVDGYIEFVKELSIKCENNKLVLSVDLATMGQSYGNYSPEILPQYVDYGVVMAYDEHTTGDDAGSVSSIGFVNDSITSCMRTFPSEQVILGLPFYTRLWTQNAEGVQAEAYGMKKIQGFISDRGGNIVWDEQAGQNYCEMTDGENRYMVWLEDVTSISHKLQTAIDHDLGGVSFWKLQQEAPEVWETIAGYQK